MRSLSNANVTRPARAHGRLKPPPVFFPNTNFSAVKRVNSSTYHSGVMAIFQCTGTYVEGASQFFAAPLRAAAENGSFSNPSLFLA